MNWSRPFLTLAVLSCLVPPPSALPQTGALPTASIHLASAPGSEDADVPQEMQDLMRSARQLYLEGSTLIKSGESAKAQIEFNKAVDMILESEWDVVSNRELHRFFQDLIRRIQQDEARYLQPQELIEEKPEQAVVDELSNLNLIPIKIDPSLTDVVEADIASTRYDIPITLNEQVLKSLNFWLNHGHKYFHDGLRRSGRYREMIERIFREESIPLDVLYLAQVESLFKTNAVSRARARGIWQFARGTAIRYGLKVNSAIDERSDPEKSTRAAARYLNDLYAMFHDWNLVLAAYNWGEGKVQKLMDRSGLNDFWEISGLRRRNFPRETKNHVPLIHASIILAHNPKKYGFTGELDPPESYHLLAIPHPIDLRAAAKILNTSVDELRELNPALRAYSTPPNYPDFQLRVVPGSDPELYRKVAELPAVKFKPPAWGSPSRYKIQEGDTLSGIAARYRVSVQALQDANDISSPRALKVGSYIRIPPRSTAAAKNASKGTSVSQKRASANRTRAGSSAGRKKSHASAKTPPSAMKSGKQQPGAPIAPSPGNAPAKSRTSASVLKGSPGTDK